MDKLLGLLKNLAPAVATAVAGPLGGLAILKYRYLVIILAMLSICSNGSVLYNAVTKKL